MAKKALKNKQERQAKFKVREYALPAVRPCSSRVPALPALSHLLPELAHAGELPGVTKASW